MREVCSPPAGPEWQLLCKPEDIPDGEARGFDPCGTGETTVFLVRKGSAIFAYRDICPHTGRTGLAWKRHAYLSGRGDRIQCSAHGAQFRIEDGVCTLGVCLGQSLDPVRIAICDGNVWIDRDDVGPGSS